MTHPIFPFYIRLEKYPEMNFDIFIGMTYLYNNIKLANINKRLNVLHFGNPFHVSPNNHIMYFCCVCVCVFIVLKLYATLLRRIIINIIYCHHIILNYLTFGQTLINRAI